MESKYHILFIIAGYGNQKNGTAESAKETCLGAIFIMLFSWVRVAVVGDCQHRTSGYQSINRKQLGLKNT